MASALEWKGLLKWSLQHHDGTAPSEVKPLTADNRRWLEEVMASLVLDESKRIVELLDQLGDAAGAAERGEARDEDGLEQLLDELEDIVCQIDYACFFVKLRGYDAVATLLASPQALLRERGAGLVATVAQNNPEAQEAAVAKPGFLAGLAAVAAGDAVPRVRAAALGALSAMVTNYAEGAVAFWKQDVAGPVLLERSLRIEEDADPGFALRRKAAFVAKKLFLGPPLSQERRAALAAVVALLVDGAASEDGDFREKALAAVLAWGRHHAAEDLRAREAQLRSVFDARRAAMRASDEEDGYFDQERELWQGLIAVLDGQDLAEPAEGNPPSGTGQDATAPEHASVVDAAGADAPEALLLGPPTADHMPQ